MVRFEQFQPSHTAAVCMGHSPVGSIHAGIRRGGAVSVRTADRQRPSGGTSHQLYALRLCHSDGVVCRLHLRRAIYWHHFHQTDACQYAGSLHVLFCRHHVVPRWQCVIVVRLSQLFGVPRPDASMALPTNCQENEAALTAL